MKREIWRISDVNECHDVNGLAIPVLIYRNPRWPVAGEVLRRDAGDATLEELVHLCDRDAENRNAHEFCGVHRLLAGWLYQRYGRTDATSAMRQIAEFGGVHGMAGICQHKGETDAYAELGVGKAGYDWDGSFGA